MPIDIQEDLIRALLSPQVISAYSGAIAVAVSNDAFATSNDPLLTITMAAKHVGLSPGAFRQRLATDKDLQSIRRGSNRMSRFKRHDLDQWQDSVRAGKRRGPSCAPTEEDVPLPLLRLGSVIRRIETTAFPPCVYLLVKNGLVVYVGQTKNLWTRVAKHKQDKMFDEVLYLQVPEPELLHVEDLMISILRPELNKTLREPLSCSHVAQAMDLIEKALELPSCRSDQ